MDTLMAGHQKNEKKESDTAFVFEKTLMILLVSAAVVPDFKTWRIPNWLVLIGMETGIFVTIQREGWRMGGIQVVLGIVLPIALLFLLYQFGFLGAGDIKLFAALGAFIGMEVWRIVLYSFLFGGVLSLLYMVKNVWIPWLKHRRRRRHRRNKIHFSMAILLGCLLYCQWG